MKQNRKKSLFDNPSFAKAFSVLLAVFCWLSVAMMNVSEYQATFSNVPVNASLQKDQLAQQDLNIIEISPTTVSVEVKGERGAVGKLTAEELTAAIQIPADLVEPNVYDLKLTPANPADSYRVVEYRPKQVRVRIDRLEHKAFDVVPIVSGVSTPAGYILEEETVAPKQVVVTGPTAEVAKIARCVVKHDLNQALDKTYAQELDVVLEDAQGNPIDLAQHHLTLSSEKVQLVIPVLREKELPLEIRFLTVPDYFPIGDLHYSMSNYEVMAAGPADIISRYQELILAHIDLRSISLDSSVFTFDVEMPAPNIVNLDNIHSVTVTFSTTGWSESAFNLNDVELLHKPSRYNVTLLSESLPNVRMCGERDTLEGMTADDVVAQVDLSEKELTPGQYKYPVKISVPTKGLVWATGEYYVVIQVSEKEAS